MYISRHLEAQIEILKEKYPILAVTGPRQSGKTTLLQQLFQDYDYVSLENFDIREHALRDPNHFLQTYPGNVVFDEVQRAPHLFSYLQTKTDLDKKMGQYILSGSQNFMLLKNISQSLAGRVALLKLLPFSYGELEKEKMLFDSISETMFHGFYPALFDRKIAPTQFFPNYIETYLERDVQNILSVRNMRQFRIFMKICAGRVGQILNLQTLATDVGITIPTAKSWLSVLESSYIVFLMHPYYRNFSKRLIKSPKLYFYDTGLVCNLLEIDSPKYLESYYQKGNIFENFLIADLNKQQFNLGKRPSFWFWRDSNKNEIDLLYEANNRLTILEIKSGMTVSSDYFKNLRKFQSFAGEYIDKAYVVYGGEQEQIREEAIVKSWRNIHQLL